MSLLWVTTWYAGACSPELQITLGQEAGAAAMDNISLLHLPGTQCWDIFPKAPSWDLPVVSNPSCPQGQPIQHANLDWLSCPDSIFPSPSLLLTVTMSQGNCLQASLCFRLLSEQLCQDRGTGRPCSLFLSSTFPQRSETAQGVLDVNSEPGLNPGPAACQLWVFANPLSCLYFGRRHASPYAAHLKDTTAIVFPVKGALELCSLWLCLQHRINWVGRCL